MPKKARVKKREEHAKSLVMARSACLALAEFAVGKAKVIILGDRQREEVASLIEEFGRLDAKERKQQKEGAKGAIHGVKGGRPRKSTKKSATKARAKT